MKRNLSKFYRHAILDVSLFLISVQLASAQSPVIGIGTSSPDPSAKLDVVATNKGLLIPRVNLQSVSDIVTIIAPANALLVYNLNPAMVEGSGAGFYFNAGSANAAKWTKISGQNNAWLTTGNAGLTNNNFLGTTDNIDFIFKRNGLTTLQVMQGGALLATGNAEGVAPAIDPLEKGMIWVPAKAAFRAGGPFSTETNTQLSAIGQNSFAVGAFSAAAGDNSVAIGGGAKVFGDNSVYLGGGAAVGKVGVFGNAATRIVGHVTSLKGDFATAIGTVGTADGDHGTSFIYSKANGLKSVAINLSTNANGNNAVALGENTSANVRGGFAMGIFTDSVVANPDDVKTTDKVFIIGNGSSVGDRLNILEVQRNGNLLIEGTLTAKNGVVSPSDIRLKERITPLHNVLDKLKNIQPVYFNYKDAASYSGAHQLGFVAQQVKSQFPEFVRKGDDGYLAVSYPSISAVAIEAIKEQQQMLLTEEKLQQDMGKEFKNQQKKITDYHLLINQLIKSNQQLKARSEKLKEVISEKNRVNSK